MTAYILVKVACDKITGKTRCGRYELVEEADSRSIARLMLAEEGWTTMMAKGVYHDRCPDHNPIREGIATEADTRRTNARMKTTLDRNRRSAIERTIPTTHRKLV